MLCPKICTGLKRSADTVTCLPHTSMLNVLFVREMTVRSAIWWVQIAAYGVLS